MEFYVYVWRDASGLPFYVGKGKGRRAYSTNGRSVRFTEMHAKGGCTVEIVDEFIHESQAHAYEVELIERYGRQDRGGLLVNLTDGGDGVSGWVPSAETRNKIAAARKGQKNWLGKRHSPASRAKMSTSRTGLRPTQATKDKLSAMMVGNDYALGHVHSAETKQRMRSSHIGVPQSENHVGNKKISLQRSSVRADNQSGFKGVTSTANGKWRARIRHDGKEIVLGRYEAPEDAAKAYDRAAIELWGADNCYLNFRGDENGARH